VIELTEHEAFDEDGALELELAALRERGAPDRARRRRRRLRRASSSSSACGRTSSRSIAR
jgi:hypothetical protein